MFKFFQLPSDVSKVWWPQNVAFHQANIGRLLIPSLWKDGLAGQRSKCVFAVLWWKSVCGTQIGIEIYLEESDSFLDIKKRCTELKELAAECCPENQGRRKGLENR